MSIRVTSTPLECNICRSELGDVIRICPCRVAHWECQMQWARTQQPDADGVWHCEICRTAYARYAQTMITQNVAVLIWVTICMSYISLFVLHLFILVEYFPYFFSIIIFRNSISTICIYAGKMTQMVQRELRMNVINAHASATLLDLGVLLFGILYWVSASNIPLDYLFLLGNSVIMVIQSWGNYWTQKEIDHFNNSGRYEWPQQPMIVRINNGTP